MKKDNNEVRTGFSDEIWGVVFVSTAVFILISMVSFVISPSENILGPIFGVAFSAGLEKLFGITASFMLPLGIFSAGLIFFRGRKVSVRGLVFWVVLTIEMCILFAIKNLPVIDAMEKWNSNITGNMVTYLLFRIFGPRMFGPYFIFILAFILTIAAALKIKIRDIIDLAIKGFIYLRDSVKPFIVKLGETFKRKDRALVNEAQGGQEERPEEQPALSGEGGAAAAEKNGDDAREKLLEKELAEFREEKDKPVQIASGEVEDASSSEEFEEIREEDVPEDGPPEDTDIPFEDHHDEDYYKVAPEERKKKTGRKPLKKYRNPSTDVLPDPPQITSEVDRRNIEENVSVLEKALANFGIEGKVVNVSPGPVITRYEIKLAPGIQINKIVNLQNDLSLAVGGRKIRIEAPIPGKALVGIELPNEEMQVVHFKHVLTSKSFEKVKSGLPVIIGKTISGTPFSADIRKMPHLLIAGQTGSGKSVCINTMICSLLMSKKPDELRLILIDPKKVEMSYYSGIPHLMSPVVTETKEAVKALQWGVGEMNRRYRLLAKVHARNIASFNQKVAQKKIKEGVISDLDNKPLPFIVIIVDELADLMMMAKKDVEALVQRIAQLARAVGIHLIVATQRPSVDIITGLIKANLTSRIAFRTIQSTDSRTILGHVGAEKLLGRGDMLFLRSGAAGTERFHGAFISEEEVEKVVAEIKAQNVDVDKIESFTEATEEKPVNIPGVKMTSFDEGSRDENFEEAARLVVSSGQGSTSMLQRRLKLGYARAGRIMDELNEAGIVGQQDGSKMREVLIGPEELESLLENIRKGK